MPVTRGNKESLTAAVKKSKTNLTKKNKNLFSYNDTISNADKKNDQELKKIKLSILPDKKDENLQHQTKCQDINIHNHDLSISSQKQNKNITDIDKSVPGFIDPIKLQLMYQDAIQHIENVVQIENDKGIFDSSAALDYDFLKSEVFKKSFQTGFVNQKASKIINKYDTIHLNSKEGK